MRYQNDLQLEQSAIVANCCMNRERDLVGTNGYEAELGFDPLAVLMEFAKRKGQSTWLDLCCGTGKALMQAAKRIEKDGLPIAIVGVDLVGMFYPSPSNHVTLIEASLSSWKPEQQFDLITCVHGLHYIGDKLGLISRACSWLSEDGIFVGNLDLQNLRLDLGGYTRRIFRREFQNAGIDYHRKNRLVECHSNRNLSFPFDYLGADDQAGPNYTKQPAVNSYYECLNNRWPLPEKS